jgi:hypothetical protein
MSTMPPLPEAYGWFDIRGEAADGYTADQMHAYALQYAAPLVEALEACTQSLRYLMLKSGGYRADLLALKEAEDALSSHKEQGSKP